MQLIKVLGAAAVVREAGQGTDKAITHCGTHTHTHTHYGAHCAALSIRIRIRIRLVRNAVQSKPL